MKYFILKQIYIYLLKCCETCFIQLLFCKVIPLPSNVIRRDRDCVIPVATDWAIAFRYTWQQKPEEPTSLFLHFSPTEASQFVFVWDGWWHAAVAGRLLSLVSTACDT
jgi:hypothetical protein